MANYNARLAEDNARYQAERQQDKVRRVMGAARVAVNKSGIAMSGSPLDVLADSAMQAELDRQAILRQGAAQAAMDRLEGSQAMQAGYFGAATALLSGTSKAMGSVRRRRTRGRRPVGLLFQRRANLQPGKPTLPLLAFGNLAPG